MSTQYDINYDDSRFKTVESEKQAALTEHEKTYDSMISNSDAYYQKQIDASTEWEKKQTDLQNQQTDFAIQKIEQQKADAQKDYTKEQSGAYVDWQKQSKQHGVRAEQIADKGLQNTGYSESSQVSMYNSYQQRVATALESFNRIVTDYNNSITQARLQNNATLAEIAYKSLQQRLQYDLERFQSKNQLLLDKTKQKLEIENSYYNRYQDVLKQINTENALAEQIRQYNESLALEREQFEYYSKKASGSGGGGSGGRSSGSGSGSGSGNGYQSTKTSSSDKLPKDTRDSLLSLGEGPISADYANKLVQSGKATVSQSKTTGNPIFSKNTIQTTSTKKTSSSSSSKKSSGSSVVSKVTNWVKNLFK